MAWSWRLTDEQFLARLRRGQRYRRWVGAMFLVLGLLVVAATIYIWKGMWEQAAEITRFASVEEPMTEEQMQATEDHFQWSFGLIIGFFMGTGVYVGLQMTMMGGLRLLFPDRTTRMLLACYDQQKTGEAGGSEQGE